MRKQKWIIWIGLCVLIVLLISGCKTSNAAERIPPEELEQLRLVYPYNDKNRIQEEFAPITQFEDLSALQNNYDRPAFDAVICAVYGETEIIGNSVFASVTVEKALWGGKELQAGDDVFIGLGNPLTSYKRRDYEHCFFPGQRYVLMVNRAESEYVGTYYPTNKYTAYYVTEDDIILSVTSEPGIDECSGMTVSAFQKMCSDVLERSSR